MAPKHGNRKYENKNHSKFNGEINVKLQNSTQDTIDNRIKWKWAGHVSRLLDDNGHIKFQTGIPLAQERGSGSG